MTPTMKMTLDGLVRALRTRAEIAAADRIEEARRERDKPRDKPRQEDRDERRA